MPIHCAYRFHSGGKHYFSQVLQKNQQILFLRIGLILRDIKTHYYPPPLMDAEQKKMDLPCLNLEGKGDYFLFNLLRSITMMTKTGIHTTPYTAIHIKLDNPKRSVVMSDRTASLNITPSRKLSSGLYGRAISSVERYTIILHTCVI